MPLFPSTSTIFPFIFPILFPILAFIPFPVSSICVVPVIPICDVFTRFPPFIAVLFVPPIIDGFNAVTFLLSTSTPSFLLFVPSSYSSVPFTTFPFTSIYTSEPFILPPPASITLSFPSVIYLSILYRFLAVIDTPFPASMFPPSLFVTSPFSAFIITFPLAVMPVSPMFSKCPFLTSPYTSPLACSFPLSFLINVSAISARFPSDSIFPLLFSIIPASTYVSSFPFISPISVFNTFPFAFIYRFLSLKRFPLFSILSAFNTRVVVPFISFALSRFPFVSILSILDTMFSFNITPCSAISSSVFFLSIFSFTVIFFAFNVVA